MESGNNLNNFTGSRVPVYNTTSSLNYVVFAGGKYLNYPTINAKTVVLVSREINNIAHDEFGTLLSPQDGTNYWHRNNDPDGAVVGACNYIYDETFPTSGTSARNGTTWVDNINVGSGTTTRWPCDNFGVILTIIPIVRPLGILGRDRGFEDRYFNGFFGELIIFERDLKTSEIDMLSRHLMEKWSNV